MTTDNRTVAAISTPPGKGGVALIRISGDSAIEIASRIFKPAGSKKVAELESRYCAYGKIVLNGEVIDDGMLTLFRSPSSFTGENVAEICCHGGTLVSAAVLRAALAGGAIPAPAGEFTRRAYLNGKLSLSEAEAIGDLLEAKTDAQLKLARSGADGRLSAEVSHIYQKMLTLCSSIFALVDYPEEDLAELGEEEMLEILSDVQSRLLTLCDSYSSARVITEGISTVICGAANTGKSTLYNALAGKDLAIVTDIEGTTRDTLSCEVALGDVLLCINDTAGIRESNDAVERIGIERSIAAIEDSSLILCVFDGSRELKEQDISIIDRIQRAQGKCAIALINKGDVGVVCDTDIIKNAFEHVLFISAKNGDGINELSSLLHSLYISDKLDLSNGAILQNARQSACALAALDAVNDAYRALCDKMPPDMAACDVERAMSALGELDGQSVSEDITNEIFSKFCVGK